jgi:hypothetical protein
MAIQGVYMHIPPFSPASPIVELIYIIYRWSVESGRLAWVGDKRVSSEDSPLNKQGQTDGLLSYSVYDLWDSTLPINHERYNTVPWGRHIRGDSEYLVLLAERGYVVWCLEDGTVLPLPNQSPRSIL